MKKSKPRKCKGAGDSSQIASATSALSEDWIRLPKKGERICGLSRSTLSDLCCKGVVRSAFLGGSSCANRGVRLIYMPSLKAFLLSQMAAQDLKNSQRSE